MCFWPWGHCDIRQVRAMILDSVFSYGEIMMIDRVALWFGHGDVMVLEWGHYVF